MSIKGKVFLFGDNVNTDEIIPARYLNTSDPNELAKYCMEDVRPGFGRREDIRGGIIVAGENFGSGSSREHAPIAIKYSGISCVVAKSYARIFFRNCINIGLPIVELKETDEFDEGDIVEIDLESGRIRNLTKSREYSINPYPDFLRGIIERGGWLGYLRSLKEMGT
ncbi:MAG TPA: 3-isopropylmalate dehydratase small subunit [Thermotogales bacterium]|nr:3-isopropylmalate dehydratase small subunit [Thermotogales bacterium]